ncbi:hypothetical protein YC2023_099405 [Brassica napus]
MRFMLDGTHCVMLQISCLIDPQMRKSFVMGALGSSCKDVKLRLWKEYKRDTNSVAEPSLILRGVT